MGLNSYSWVRENPWEALEEISKFLKVENNSVHMFVVGHLKEEEAADMLEKLTKASLGTCLDVRPLNVEGEPTIIVGRNLEE